VYESALKKNPRDAALASKMGQALIKMHLYHKVSDVSQDLARSDWQVEAGCCETGRLVDWHDVVTLSVHSSMSPNFVV